MANNQAVMILARAAFGSTEEANAALEDLRNNPTLSPQGLHDARVGRKLDAIQATLDVALGAARAKAGKLKGIEKQEAEANANAKDADLKVRTSFGNLSKESRACMKVLVDLVKAIAEEE